MNPVGRLAHPSDTQGRLGVPASKVTLPWMRPGLVARERLLDRLDACQTPLVTVTAPAGFGKTTLLAQWCERSTQATAWVSVGPEDNDPVALLRAIAVALDQVEALDEPVRARLSRPLHSETAPLRTLDAVLSSRRIPFVLVLDGVEVLEDPRSLDIVEALAVHQLPGSQLAVASRSEAGRTARERAQGAVLELDSGDLQMSASEAAALFAACGVSLDPQRLRAVLDHTEGWPAGLYLTALALDGVPPEPDIPPTGDQHPYADYIRAEVFSRLPGPTRDFMVRTSILHRLSGPLCDAVLDRTGSSQALERLSCSNLFVVPLDRTREWFRYHHLLGDFLRTELRVRHPGEEARLHERASTWFETHDDHLAAIAHAQMAGDEDRVAYLLARFGVRTYSTGRAATLRRWIDWFEERGRVDRYAAVAVLGGLLAILQGRTVAAERFVEEASVAPGAGRLPDGSTAESWVHMLRAAACAEGVDQMRKDAEVAVEELSPSSPIRASARFFLGAAHLLAGHDVEADHHFAISAAEALEIGEPSARSAALALRAVVAIRRSDWQEACSHSDTAVAAVDEAGLDDYLSSLVAFAVAARVASHLGDVDRARALAQRAQAVRPLCTYAFPPCAFFLVQLAHAHLALADPVAARSCLRQVHDILYERPDLGIVPAEANGLQQAADSIEEGASALSSLTAAELRIVPFLPTHLSLKEIGERTHLSRHTVKSHAMAIYRKAGVSSRSDAIARLREAGLLTDGDLDA